MSLPTDPPFSLDGDSLDPEWTASRRALWWDAKGDWAKAHDVIAAEHGQSASRVHAYLHRKEGDLGNAGYWYSRVGAPPFEGSLESEWAMLARDID